MKPTSPLLMILATAALILVTGGCTYEGELDATGGGSASGTPEARSEQEFADAVLEAWETLAQKQVEAASVYVQGAESGPVSELSAWIEAKAIESEAYAGVLEALPAPPAPGDLEEPYSALLDALEATVADHEDGLADLTAAREDVTARLESNDGDPTGTVYPEVVDRVNASGDEVSVACFDLQAAFEAAELRLLDCTPSADDFGDGAEQTGDPTSEPTPPGQPVTLEAGEHDFEVFERPFVLDSPEPVRVESNSQRVEIVSPDDSEYSFVVYAADEVVDPAGDLTGIQTINSRTATPDDLSGWLAGLPVEVLSTGTTTMAGADAPWWQVRAQEPFAIAQDGTALPLQIDGDTRLWLVNGSEGPVLIDAVWVPWSPLSQEEFFGYAERILAGADFGAS